MEDTIDLPDEYFNKEYTPIRETDEGGVYSLDVDDRSNVVKKTPAEEEEVEPSEIGVSRKDGNPSQDRSTYNTYNNTSDQFNTINNIKAEGDKQNLINDSNYKNISNNTEQKSEDINYNFYTENSTNNTTTNTPLYDGSTLRPSPGNDSILEQIQSIDSKINDLNSKLNNINTDSKNTFNSFVENNSDQTSINSDYTLDSEDTSPVTVVPNLFYSEKQQIRNNIFTLNNQKSKLLELLNNNTQNNLIDTNSNFENKKENITNISEEFSPNLINNTEKSLEKAIVTEKILGGEPKVVSSPSLGKVVIDERQGTLENAINEHGGIENAIRDSKQNQDLVENFFKENNSTANITNMSEGDSSIFNVDNLSPVDSSTAEPVPDNNQIIAKDTSSILSILNSITTQLGNISNNLSKLRMPSGNNGNFSANFYTSDGKSNTSQPKSNGHSASTNKEPMKSGIKGNLPLGDFFPKDFNVESLGVSNLLSRI